MAAKSYKDGNTDTQEMMDIYEKMGTPGEPHHALARLAGTWATAIRFWGPDGSPTESSGVCEQRMLLGGRFLEQQFTGEMMGSPFEGIGITGYDNTTGKYVSTWIDSMSTAILFFEGTSSRDGRTITQEATCEDPVRGPMKWRSMTMIPNDTTVLFEMYGTDKNGKEEKMMEITYTRQ